jgi:nitroimidazol reductase NimA-like FMN-containing flavoprotein (pyridoxamine 5'-phosphate oxidase superfamily)
MTRAEREAFLAGVHVGVLGVVEPDGNPLTVPIWYAYEPGEDIVVVTGTDSRKGRALDAGRFSLCAQTEDVPYKYVSVSGTVVERREVREQDRRELAHRYLGPELGDAYVAATVDHAAGSTLYVLRPEQWMTVDYDKEFG